MTDQPEDIQYHGADQHYGRWSGERLTHTVWPTKYMVGTGELTRGFTFYGPFKTVDVANEWARLNLKASTEHHVHKLVDVRNGA